ncbi:hypothetical protein D9M70_554770 [compost metagenome]
MLEVATALPGCQRAVLDPHVRQVDQAEFAFGQFQHVAQVQRAEIDTQLVELAEKGAELLHIHLPRRRVEPSPAASQGVPRQGAVLHGIQLAAGNQQQRFDHRCGDAELPQALRIAREAPRGW